VGVAIGVALLPRLSRAVHAKDNQGAQEATDEAITFAMAFTLPAAAALIAMPFYLIDGLYTRGEFHSFDAHNTANALFYYGIGTPAFVLTRVLAPAFFARQDTASPMRFALLSVVVNIVAGVALFYTLLGFSGIAAGTAIASWLTVFQMLYALNKRGQYTLGKFAAARMWRVLLASVIMGAAMFAAQHWRMEYVQPLFNSFNIIIHGRHIVGPKEISLAVVSILAGVLYVVLLFATGGVKLSELKRALRRGGKDVEEALEHTPAGPDVV
jgi:putative peptidoglycan lipid II flippase